MADLEPRPIEDLIERRRVQPRTQWAEIVGHERQIRRLREFATKIALSAEERTRLGIRLGAGIVVTGPSDCGKTQLARAFAAELGRAVIAPPVSDLDPERIGALNACSFPTALSDARSTASGMATAGELLRRSRPSAVRVSAVAEVGPPTPRPACRREGGPAVDGVPLHLDALDVTVDDLNADWAPGAPNSACLKVSAAAAAAGAEGMIVPSAAHPGAWNLDVLPEGFLGLRRIKREHKIPEPPTP